MTQRRVFWILFSLFLASLGRTAPALDLSGPIQLYREKNYEAAYAAFEALRQQQPNNPEILLHLSRVCRRQKQLDQALHWLQEATRLAPNNAAYFVALGDTYGTLAKERSSLGDASKARQALEHAVQLAPDDETTRAALIAFYREAPWFAGGSMAKAYQQAQEFRKIDPVGGARLLVLLNETEKKYEQALALCAETLRAHPDDYSLLFATGRIAVNTGSHLDEGIAALQKCLTLTVPVRTPGHVAANVGLGKLFALRKQPEEARKYFQAALAQDPQNADAQVGLSGLRAP